MLFVIHLHDMNAFWFPLIIAGKNFFSLLAIIFVMHLYITEQQEIGLKSLMLFGFWHFGTRAIIVELNAVWRKFLSKKDKMASFTSLPTMGHATLKKCEVYPSGPGDFSPLIENIVFLTSSEETDLIKSCCASAGKETARISASKFWEQILGPDILPSHGSR